MYPACTGVWGWAVSRRGYTPLEERDEAWYAASAARFNRAEARRVPLLAAMGAARQYTPEERRAEFETAQANSARIEAETNARMETRAAELRDHVGAIIGGDALAELDAYVLARRYLQSPAYRADFWHTIYRRVDDGLPPIPTQEEVLAMSRMLESEMPL